MEQLEGLVALVFPWPARVTEVLMGNGRTRPPSILARADRVTRAVMAQAAMEMVRPFPGMTRKLQLKGKPSMWLSGRWQFKLSTTPWVISTTPWMKQKRVPDAGWSGVRRRKSSMAANLEQKGEAIWLVKLVA
ncbi:hypothetical protein JOH51_007024 [Rhizobium leguminosarum]|nr:hypothetical protein [Rhizobium leguminosarum]